MLGIFGVNMPLLYGEGSMAFRRLQEEILRRDNDITVLAWGRQPNGRPVGCNGVLALSPSNFLDCGSISRFTNDSDSITVTNRGLLVSGDIPIRVVIPLEGEGYQYMVCLGLNFKKWRYMEGIILHKISPNTFYRTGVGDIDVNALDDNLTGFKEVALLSHTNFYLLTDPKHPMAQAARHRQKGMEFLHDPNQSIESVIPHELWDVADCTFLKPKPYSWHYPIYQVLGLVINYHVDGYPTTLVALCNYEDDVPKCGLHLLSACPRKLLRAFNASETINSILLSELEDTVGVSEEHCQVDIFLGGSMPGAFSKHKQW